MASIRFHRQDSEITVISLEGDFDQTGLEALENDLEALTSAHSRPAIVDISEIRSIDHYGMQFLLRWARRMHGLRSKLMLAAPQAVVEQRLRQANFHTLIPMSRDVNSGLELLAPAS